MSIDWINVSVRVPHNRRDVFVWGEERYIGLGSQPVPSSGLTGKYLGKSRFNNRTDGGRGAFDIEVNKSWICFSKFYVTHWAEIVGPYDQKPAKDGIGIIAAERQRQIAEEKFTAVHDDSHTDESLAIAAACYTMPYGVMDNTGRLKTEDPTIRPRFWPWELSWWKPCPNDRIRELAKAGALIAAEIDRKLRNLS